jgi:hypothetical protein
VNRGRRHRGGGHSAEHLAKHSPEPAYCPNQRIVGPVLGETPTPAGAVAIEDTRALLAKPITSQIGPIVIPLADMVDAAIDMAERNAQEGGKKRKAYTKKNKAKGKSIGKSIGNGKGKGKKTRKNKQSGGSLSMGPAKQLWNEVSSSFEEVANAAAGSAIGNRIANVPKFIRKEMRLLPKWLP